MCSWCDSAAWQDSVSEVCSLLGPLQQDDRLLHKLLLLSSVTLIHQMVVSYASCGFDSKLSLLLMSLPPLLHNICHLGTHPLGTKKITIMTLLSFLNILIFFFFIIFYRFFLTCCLIQHFLSLPPADYHLAHSVSSCYHRSNFLLIQTIFKGVCWTTHQLVPSSWSARLFTNLSHTTMLCGLCICGAPLASRGRQDAQLCCDQKGL